MPAHSPPLCRPFGRPKHPGDIDKGDHDGDWQRSFFALRTTEEWRKSKVSVIAQRNADTAGYANNQVRNTAATPATRCEALQLCAAGCKYRAAAKILIADQIWKILQSEASMAWRAGEGVCSTIIIRCSTSASSPLPHLVSLSGAHGHAHSAQTHVHTKHLQSFVRGLSGGRLRAAAASGGRGGPEGRRKGRAGANAHEPHGRH